jgi:uncharacterized protein YjbI with pentapeptide repeats
MIMRLGGIYALEGVMKTSDQYHQPVLEALYAFVRDATIGVIIDDTPATDVQAVLTVIGRRKEGSGDVDLTNAKIPKADLRAANLSGAMLFRINMTGAFLRGANLSHAFLEGASLEGANLGSSNLVRADLSGAFLKGADLIRANMVRTMLFRADLSGAHLEGADLSFVDLRNATVEQSQLDRACGANARLPTGLTLKPCLEAR